MYDRSPSRGVKPSNRYSSITNTILNANGGTSDIEELFINAVRDGAYERLVNILNRHTDSLVSVNIKDKRTGNTGLIWAAKRGHIKLLLKHGADITLRNYDGQTVLEVAPPVIKQTILDHVEQGVTYTPQRLLQAAWIGSYNVTRQLLSGGRPVDINCCNSDGFTPLLLSVRDIYMFEKLGTQLIKNHQPLRVVKSLIEHKSDTFAHDNEGKTALHYCASSRSSATLSILELLIQNTHTELRDRRQLTPLHYACQASNLDTVQLFVKHGADVNSRGFAGTTPLHIAAYNNQQEIATLLLEYGADATSLDDSGQSPIDLARRKLKTLLKSWKKSPRDEKITLAPVRGPGTPRVRELSARSSRTSSVTGFASSLEQSCKPPTVLASGIPSSQRENSSTRLLGAPRNLNRTNSREKLTPLNVIKHHEQHLYHKAHRHSKQSVDGDGVIRSHSTSDIDAKTNSIAHASSNDQRSDGVMSVEVLGLKSADKRKRQIGSEVFYFRTPPQHDFIVTHHTRQSSTPSPVHRLTPVTPHNPLEVHSNSPLLSTIHEDGGTLPRAVLKDSDILKQTTTSLHKSSEQAPVKTDSNHQAKEGIYSLLKSEFILDDSRIEEHREKIFEPKEATSASETKSIDANVQSEATCTSQRASKDSRTVVKIPKKPANRLKMAAKENAAAAAVKSHEVPKTVVSTILTHATNKIVGELQNKVSQGKITLHQSDLLTSDNTGKQMAPEKNKQDLVNCVTDKDVHSNDQLTSTKTANNQTSNNSNASLIDQKFNKNFSASRMVPNAISVQKSSNIQKNVKVASGTSKTAAAAKFKPTALQTKKVGKSVAVESTGKPKSPPKANKSNETALNASKHSIKDDKPSAAVEGGLDKREQQHYGETSSSLSKTSLPSNSVDKNAVTKIVVSNATPKSSQYSQRASGASTKVTVNKTPKSSTKSQIHIEKKPSFTYQPTSLRQSAAKSSKDSKQLTNNNPPERDPGSLDQDNQKTNVNLVEVVNVTEPVKTVCDTAENYETPSTRKEQTDIQPEKVTTPRPLISATSPKLSARGQPEKITANDKNDENNAVSNPTQKASSAAEIASSADNRKVYREPAQKEWLPNKASGTTALTSNAPNMRSTYQPLHLLMKAAETKPHHTGERIHNEPNDATDKLREMTGTSFDRAFNITISEHETLEYNGPAIRDIFENFPRPIYEFAQLVSRDMTEKRASSSKKKAKKPAPKSKNTRTTSGVKSKRTKGTQFSAPVENKSNSNNSNNSNNSSDQKKRVKSAKTKKAKTGKSSVEAGTDPPEQDPEKIALISGVGWHIETERSSDIALDMSDSEGEPSTSGRNSEKAEDHKVRNSKFHEMTPRQKKEQLRNLLLLMRNAESMRDHDSATISLMPETMQAIQEFVNAMPNEQELNQIFGLEYSTHHLEDNEAVTEAKSDEESIPDVSEIEVIDAQMEEDFPAMVLEPDHPSLKASLRFLDETEIDELKNGSNNTVLKLVSDSRCEADPESAEKSNGRCVSSAMTEIIDEILNTDRSVPNKKSQQPAHHLPPSLAKDIHDQWEKISQSHSNSNSNSNSLDSNFSSDQTTSTEHTSSSFNNTENHTSDPVSLSTSSSSTASSLASSVDINNDNAIEMPKERTDSGRPSYKPRISSASPAPHGKINSKNFVNILPKNLHSTGSKKSNLSFSEVEDLPIKFPSGIFDERQLTSSLKSDIQSRPYTRTVVSRLGSRRSSVQEGHVDCSTSRSSGSEDFQLLTWKKGNILGKGAYGTVYCGLTSDGHLIAVKQIELNVHDWEKAEKEYESIQEEVNLLKTLNHDNIVGFLGTSLDEHTVSIFMQFVPGGTIASLLSRFGALEERVFQKYTLQIVQGVGYLHDNGVIHRDIKGANIMLMSNGVIKLIDFGCAKRLCLQLSVSQSQVLKSMKGTPYWMAPEVIKETGHGFKSDIWSIGCTVFEMSTTKPPWSEMQPMAAIFAIGSDKPVPVLPDSFSPSAREFVEICMRRDPNLRKTAKELLGTKFLASIYSN